MTLSELSRATGLYKSTILRLLETLVRARYVTHLNDGRYALGPMAGRLGMAYDRINDISAQIVPVLDDLVAAGTESASFHVPYAEDNRLCLLRRDSGHSTLDSVRAGQLLPLRGAAGKVVAAYAGAVDLHRSVGADSIVKSRGERDPSCAGLACPVFGSNGNLIGALSLSGPIDRFTAENVETMIPLLLAAAKKLTLVFGGSCRND